MKYQATVAALSNMMLWEDYPGNDDSDVRALLMIENGQMTAQERVDEIKARYRDD